MPNEKAVVTYEQGILWIKLNNGLDVEVQDVKDMYDFASGKSGGGPFCVLYDATSTQDLSEDVVHFVAVQKDPFVIAKAYIVGDEQQMKKAKLHLAFDQPSIRPSIFHSKKEAIAWLQGFLK